MKKTIFTLLLATLFFSTMQANPVDVAMAKSLGLKFMKANTAIKAEAAELTYTAFAENGQAAFYVFALQPKGFVIVSADDRAKPILGYSTESNFTAQLPDGLMTFFDNYKAGFSQMFANNDERTAEAVTDWTSLAETGMLGSRKANRSVEPLLASIWNQTDLYNNMAPEDPSSVYSGHCKSGCVANTMSQIMRYWEWPRSGEGSHGYDAVGNYGSYGWQEADFSAATYRYELMPDYLDFASPQVEVDATALLEYHAGVSVNMGYGANASGAYSQDVGPAMESYFRFSSDYWHTYQEYSNSWEEDLMYNLDGGMPLYYASSGPDGGHAYVVDGYDDWYFFHVNWGWGGFDNGYYAIDGFYLTFYSFPWWHNAVFNLHPVDEYYDAPMAVENLEVSENAMSVKVVFNPVYETRGGNATTIDAIYIMRDGLLIDSLMNVTEPQVSYQDEVEKNGTYYYTVYAVNEAGMSKVARDTVMVGNTCDVRFELADSGNNGWDLSSIAVLDEDGKVSQRWNDNLIVASYDYPTVGEITDYEMNCDPDDVAELKQTQVLYPNPATDCFTVEGDIKEIKVFNALGQLMHLGTENTIEVTAWPEGVYFVRIVDENDAVTTVKLIKQN